MMVYIYGFVLMQIALPVVFLILAAGARALKRRRRMRDADASAAARNAIMQFIAGSIPAGAFERGIDSLSLDILLDALQNVAQAIGSDQKDRMRAAVRETTVNARLRNAILSRDWLERLSAVRFLHFLPLDEYRAEVDALRDDKQPIVRLAAIRALAGYGPADRARLLRQWPDIGWMLDHHPIYDIHIRMGGPPLLEMEDLIARENDPDALIRLARLAPMLGGSAVFLMELTRHSDERVRAAAVESMADFHSDEVRRDLSVMLEDRSWRIRAKAARSLAKHAKPSSVHALAALLLDPHPQVRLSAATALKRAGQAGIAVLRFMSKKSQSPERRRLIAQVMGLPER